MLKFKVTGQRLMRTDGCKVVGDSRNYLKAKFDFSEDWDDYTPRIASFWRDNLILEPMQAVLDSSGTCVVPWEMLQREGVMRVSVCAGDLVTANEVCVMIDKAGKIGVLESTDPSPGVYANIYNRLTSLEELVKTFGNASLDIVDELPDVENAEENVLYLLKNSETGYYDVYVLIDEELVLIDDRDIDLSDYYTKEETDETLTDYYTKEETDETLTDYYTKEETDETLTDYYTKEETDSALGSYLPLSGGTMSGDIDMNGEDVTGAGNVTAGKVITPKVTAEKGTNVVVTNTFETSTYDSVVDTVKLNSSGFDISGVSTKEDGTVYTNQIKTSNSKMTVNANDLAVNSAKSIAVSAEGAVSAEASGTVDISSNSTVTLSGNQVDINAGIQNVNIYSSGNVEVGAGTEINLTAESTATLEGAKVEITSSGEDIELNSSSGVDISADYNVYVEGENINIETKDTSGSNGDIKIISPYTGEATGSGVGTIRAALTNMDTEDLEEYRSSKIYIGKDNVVLGILKGRDMDEEGAYPTVTEDITTGIKARKTEEGFYTQVVGKLKAEGVEADSLSVNEGITGDLKGNAETAAALETARTIQTDLASTAAASFDGTADITPGVTGVLPIANGGTGGTTAEEARENLELDDYYKKKRYAYVGTDDTVSGDCWFKFAEVSASSYRDPTISFKVRNGYAGTYVDTAQYSGILTAHVRHGSGGTVLAAQLVWEYADKFINTSNFVIAYGETTAELWAKVTMTNSFWHFDVITEGDRDPEMSSPAEWTLYQTKEYTSEITADYTQAESTLGTLLNSTNGNAATATALKTARTIQTNLASTSSVSFDGSANVTPGVTGVLPLTNGGTGASSAADARTNLELDKNYRRWGYAYAALTSNEETDNWFKFAECSMDTNNTSVRISFKVNSGYAYSPAEEAGILTAQIRRGSYGYVEPSQTQLGWEYAGSEVKPEDFVLAYSDSDPVTVELWVNITDTHKFWHFNVIDEGERASNTNCSIWTLYQTREHSSEITEGYTQIVSSLVTLQNDTLGNAAGLTGTLGIANGGTGAVTAEEARTNLELDDNYRKYKYAFAGTSANTGTDNWLKFAEISVDAANTDKRISFKVSAGTGTGLAGYTGILTAHVRTGSETQLRPYQSGLWWEYAGSEINPEDFVMAYSDSVPVVIELWANVPVQYNYWHFDVIAEGQRNTNTNFTDWTLYRTTNYQSEITEGYTQIVSTLSTLQNDTTGAAATLSETLSVEKGGTGGTTAAEARANLGLGEAAVKNVDTEVTSGSENLITSSAVYEAIQAMYEKIMSEIG
ncbi:MAG: hypothetical protein LIO87_01110 [Eubacterium sp.]|nr:hypothetical protein [Eubacterium sp.]